MATNQINIQRATIVARNRDLSRAQAREAAASAALDSGLRAASSAKEAFEASLVRRAPPAEVRELCGSRDRLTAVLPALRREVASAASSRVGAARMLRAAEETLCRLQAAEEEEGREAFFLNLRAVDPGRALAAARATPTRPVPAPVPVKRAEAVKTVPARPAVRLDGLTAKWGASAK